MRRDPVLYLTDCYHEDKPVNIEAWLRRLPEGSELEVGPEGDVIGFSLEINVSFADGNIVSAIDKIANELKKTIFQRDVDESWPQTTGSTHPTRQDG